jgi:hypothetical protein
MVALVLAAHAFGALTFALLWRGWLVADEARRFGPGTVHDFRIGLMSTELCFHGSPCYDLPLGYSTTSIDTGFFGDLTIAAFVLDVGVSARL